MTEERLQKLALRRAKAKLGWYMHATVYVLVNLFLIALSASSGRHWAVFPLAGWGIGLAAHWASVWLLPPGGVVLQRMAAKERSRLAAAETDPW